MAHSFDLDTRLLRLSGSDYFTVRDATQGVCDMGGIGSGKTSGSGKALAHAYLRAGMGGLVCCAKPEETTLWRRYCAETGRASSLIVVDGTKPAINFVAYELARQGSDGLNSVVECLMRVVEMANLAGATPGKGSDAFWTDTSKQILRHSLPVMFAATGTVELDALLRFVREAPDKPEQMRDPDWQASSFFYAMFARSVGRLDDATGARAIAYWKDDFARLDAKTRGNILISLTTALDRFNHGWLHRTFCTDTAIVPELCFHGAVIVMDMPALTRNEDGVVAQQLLKYLFQRAVLARNGLAVAQQERPVFLWADEAQYFVNSYDAEFLSTCRGSRACTVFLSQSLPTYYARMSGENARDRVHHLLGNFATRIWHSNACAETNDWAARTIGRSLQQRRSANQSEGDSHQFGMNMGEGTNWGSNSGTGGGSSSGQGGGSSNSSWNRGTSEGGNEQRGRNRGSGSTSGRSWGHSEQMDHIIEPGQFGRMLRTGGPANGNRVSAVWYQAGRRFASGGNALLAEFVQ